MKWCQYHSIFDLSDGGILGASSAAQLEQYCEDSAKGPLPQEVVDALGEACQIARAHEGIGQITERKSDTRGSLTTCLLCTGY